VQGLGHGSGQQQSSYYCPVKTLAKEFPCC
jgi:hypothetical protein